MERNFLASYIFFTCFFFFFLSLQHHSGLEDISPSEEVTDMEDNDEEDLGVLDDQRSVILHLLSQLKLGMDLTRVRRKYPTV